MMKGPETVIKAEFSFDVRGDELDNVSACMLGAVAPASLAHEAVLELEMGLLRQGWPVGQSLGALPDVRKGLGIGRPAFREAVTILEARGLLDVRRGPGGGLFVSAPALEDVAGAVLMYLALSKQTRACIEEFRLLVWRMITNSAVQRRLSPNFGGSTAGHGGFAADLAHQVGNSTMELLARLSEMLIRISDGREAPASDDALELAINQADIVKAFARLDELSDGGTQPAPVISFELAERGFSLSGRKSAMALAARMTREISNRSGSLEAEWETAERLGYTDAVVRQARRILQDFGIVRCRQGHKGAELAAPTTAPTGVIRLLAPCLVAGDTSALNNREAISSLLSNTPALAAQRVKDAGRKNIKPVAPAANPEGFEALALEHHLLDLSGNPLLAIVVRSLGLASIYMTGTLLAPPELGDVSAINRRILQAIEAGDVGAASELARMKLTVMQCPAENFCEVA